MNTRSSIFFTRILARAQISSLTSEGFFIEVLSVTILETTKTKNVNRQNHKRGVLRSARRRGGVAVCKPLRRAHTLRS